MHWFAFIILAIVMLTVQAACAPGLEIHGIRPDFLLVVVVFLGLYANETDAVIAAWSLGFCADLMTIERMGLLSLSYALAAMMVTSVREYLFRSSWITQFALTAAVVLLIHTIWMLYRRLVHRPFDSALGTWTTGCLLLSVYTAAWAPLVHSGLLRFSRLLGIAPPGHTSAGSHTREGAHV